MIPTYSILSKEMIKVRYGFTTYQRGLTYYNRGRVVNLKYDYEQKIWFAEVEGNYVYDVAIEIFEEDFSASCDCPAYDTFGQCKHEVAVLFAILGAEEKEDIVLKAVNRLKKQEYDNTNRLIDTLSQQQYTVINSSNPAKQPLKIEFTLKAHPVSPTNGSYFLTIDMKTGLERALVVKKIKQFLSAVETQESYYFTQKFTYDPAEHYYEQEDLEIIKILQGIVRNEKLYFDASPNYWNNSSFVNDRELIIPPIMAEALIQQLKNRSVMVEFPGHNHLGIDFLENQQLPFSFALNKAEDEDYKLDLWELRQAVFFEAYGYLFIDSTFYNLTTQQQRVIKELLSYVNKRNGLSLTIAKDQIASFLSHVEPVIKKIGNLSIDDSISDHIIAPPLKAKTYIDFNQEQLQVKVEYHYSERIVNPFQPEQQDDTDDKVILMRDISKEQEIMNIIESAPLKYNGREMYLEGEDELYHFLFHTLPLLEDKTEIFMTGSSRSLIMSEQHKPVVSIELDSSENWLDVSFDIDGIDNQDVHNILQSMIEKKRYYRLPNGAFIAIDDEEFEPVRQLIDELEIKKSDLNKEGIKRPVYKGIQIEGISGSGYNPSIQYGKTFRRFIQHFKNPEQLDYDIPDSINATLRDYQIFGFQWLKTLARYRLGGILADDMGLGKTLQSIAFITSEKEENKNSAPVLIVTPASVLYNWKNEFKNFSPELEVRIVNGTPEERKNLLQNSSQVDVWITTYPLLRQDSELYHNEQFAALILDEAQAVKNPATKTFKAVQQIKADKRFALSGTPIENKIEELWAIFQVILPGLFPNKTTFKNLSHDKIAKIVRPFILRRIKKDVLKELPDKIETVQVSELTKNQKEVYLGYLQKIQQETKDSIQNEGFNKSRIKILAGLTRLRQICNHPSLFLDNYTGESGKLEQLMELVDNALANGNRLLIFSQFASMLQMIKDRLQGIGLSCFYLDGKTPSEERVVMADKFNRGEQNLFLVSLKAGGTGLNLTGADTVILFDLWWNPAVEEQAAGRAHRIGQKKVVQVIRLITYGTIEEKIYELQQKKKGLIEKVIQPGETMLTSMSEEEILEILSL